MATQDSAGSEAKLVEQEEKDGGKQAFYEVKDGQFADSIQLAFMFLTNVSTMEEV